MRYVYVCVLFQESPREIKSPFTCASELADSACAARREYEREARTIANILFARALFCRRFQSARVGVRPALPMGFRGEGFSLLSLFFFSLFLSPRPGRFGVLLARITKYNGEPRAADSIMRGLLVFFLLDCCRWIVACDRVDFVFLFGHIFKRGLWKNIRAARERMFRLSRPWSGFNSAIRAKPRGPV